MRNLNFSKSTHLKVNIQKTVKFRLNLSYKGNVPHIDYITIIITIIIMRYSNYVPF